MIKVYTQAEQGQKWLRYYRGKTPLLACVLGFTQTGLIPGISAAGATPQARQYTAIADAEFLYNGLESEPKYSLPPLQVGVSPVFISRAVVEALNAKVYLFNAGLPIAPTVPTIDLGGVPAQCLSSAQALPLATVEHLFAQGWQWGENLAAIAAPSYLMISECVVGGTTTALGILTGLGMEADGKVNSSHPQCNHQQKWSIVQAGLNKAKPSFQEGTVNPFALVAALGDPMQIAAAGMALAASRTVGVMLAGGTQMLAVFALSRAIAEYYRLEAQLEKIVVGTTRWVAEDPSGDTVGLAQAIGDLSLLATNLDFSASKYEQLRAYEQGYVKEGVGAGGCAIAASLQADWKGAQLLAGVESLVSRYYALRMNPTGK